MVEAMKEYNVLPEFVDIYITQDAVLDVAKKLNGSGGPGQTDAKSLQNWLILVR